MPASPPRKSPGVLGPPGQRSLQPGEFFLAADERRMRLPPRHARSVLAHRVAGKRDVRAGP